MSRIKFIVAITLLCFSTSFLSVRPQADKLKDELRVLFIGNSLTYTNDLPAIVEALAQAAKQKRFIYQSLTYPNLSLEDQWNRGEAQKLLAKEKWDVVVLQQGPSGLEESRRSLIEYTRRFTEAIRAAGAEPALFMVWPAEARINDFDRVIQSYKLAADEVKGLLFPVGAAWRAAWKRDSTIALYSEDRFHPSALGSYLAALVIYEKLFHRSPVGLPARLKIHSKFLDKLEVTQEQANLLQAAAVEANRRF